MLASSISTPKTGFRQVPGFKTQPVLTVSRARTVQCRAATLKSCRMIGVGSAVPETVLTNDDLSKFVDTNDEWISSRTGIHSRHVLGEGESLVKMAEKASKSALEMAGISASDVDIVLFATSSADDVFGNACQVQAAIGATKAVAFDLTAACSGFVLAMITATQYIRAGAAKNVLVVGGDALSRFVDWRDRSTCILFGDGCGAVVMSQGEEGSPCCLMGMAMHSDGTGSKHLNGPFIGGTNKCLSPDGASKPGAYANIHMAGQDVFKFAVRSVPAVIEEALVNAHMQKEEVQWLVMHQANQRIMDAAAQRLGLPNERVITNLAQYGNTSAASIPLALDGAVRAGTIKKGDVMAMAGFGAGLTWTGAIVRWG